jgi:hypothetical protein
MATENLGAWLLPETVRGATGKHRAIHGERRFAKILTFSKPPTHDVSMSRGSCYIAAGFLDIAQEF